VINCPDLPVCGESGLKAFQNFNPIQLNQPLTQSNPANHLAFLCLPGRFLLPLKAILFYLCAIAGRLFGYSRCDGLSNKNYNACNIYKFQA
jgi:hypothetical protein